MAQEAQSRVQTAMRDFVNDVDKAYLRGMEREMHLCAAECCGSKTASINDVLACKERCESKTLGAQKYLQSELDRFQESLSRCVLSCQDDIKDKVTPNTSQADIEKYRNEFDACGIKCCDNSVAKLPGLSQRVKEAFKSGQL